MRVVNDLQFAGGLYKSAQKVSSAPSGGISLDALQAGRASAAPIEDAASFPVGDSGTPWYVYAGAAGAVAALGFVAVKVIKRRKARR